MALWTRLAGLLAVCIALLTWHMGSAAHLSDINQPRPIEAAKSAAADAVASQLHRRIRRSRLSVGGGSTIGRFLNAGTAPPALQKAAQLDSTVLECEFSGSPPPTIDWLYDGQLVRKTGLQDSVEEQANGLDALLLAPSEAMVATRSRLYLNCITPAHQGTYTCQGQTPYQVKSMSTSLFVEDVVSREGMAWYGCEQVKDTSVQPARIIQWRPRVLAKMGSRVRLVCENTGYPVPVVTWRKNDEPVLVPSQRVVLMPNGDLVIESLRWSDMGKYWCSAANAFSTDEISTFLYPFKG